MEIPYVSEPRKDTGLYNAKVGIWLFLASEVMLFGGLFSSYVILRVGAAPGTWPTELLGITVGTLNTIVLILSSVTVVLAWSALKLNNFRQYRIFQTVTVLCALTFLVVKSFEYAGKFTHYDMVLANPVALEDGTALPEGTRIDGHLQESGEDDSGLAYYVLGHPVWYPAEEGIASRTAAVREMEEQGLHPSPVRVGESDIVEGTLTNWGPWANTYLAIYFTLTGLHALHVLIGALVIAWILWPGEALWRKDPERYTNRVEVSGLFWHFVDLVWIFLFPVLYLL